MLGDCEREHEPRLKSPVLWRETLKAGVVAARRSSSYIVIGDTVNTSARLCSIAAGGQNLVSEATAIQLGGKFRLQPLPDAALKGKESPTKIFEVRR